MWFNEWTLYSSLGSLTHYALGVCGYAFRLVIYKGMFYDFMMRPFPHSGWIELKWQSKMVWKMGIVPENWMQPAFFN